MYLIDRSPEQYVPGTPQIQTNPWTCTSNETSPYATVPNLTDVSDESQDSQEANVPRTPDVHPQLHEPRITTPTLPNPGSRSRSHFGTPLLEMLLRKSAKGNRTNVLGMDNSLNRSPGSPLQAVPTGSPLQAVPTTPKQRTPIIGSNSVQNSPTNQLAPKSQNKHLNILSPSLYHGGSTRSKRLSPSVDHTRPSEHLDLFKGDEIFPK